MTLPPSADGRPQWELLDGPGMQGLSMPARLQVITAINTCLLLECIKLAGGEIVLPPGFQDRLSATESVTTRFLEDGSYQLKAVPTMDEQGVVGLGGRFERLRGPGKEPEVFEVIEEDVGTGQIGLVQVLPHKGQVMIQVRERALRKERGWRRWRPPLELIDGIAGKQ